MKYKYIIDIVIKYAFTAMKYGFEYKDLYQEALVGFSDALNSYKDDKKYKYGYFYYLVCGKKITKIRYIKQEELKIVFFTREFVIGSCI